MFNSKFTKKHAIIITLIAFALVGTLALTSGVKNYFEYFAGFFVGVTLVFGIVWIIIMVKTLLKK